MGKLTGLIDSATLQSVVLKIFITASLLSLAIDLGEVDKYIDGVTSLRMLCSNSTLPVVNMDSQLTNPYFPLTSYWLSEPQPQATCYWAGLQYVAMPLNISDIQNDIFTDKTEDRWVLESLLQLPNCDVGAGVTYNAARKSTATKYNYTSNAFGRAYEECPNAEYRKARDIDLVLDTWTKECLVLVSQQNVRENRPSGVKSHTYNCSLPLRAPAFPDCSVTYMEIRQLVVGSGSYSVQLVLPLIFVMISFCIYFYSTAFSLFCPLCCCKTKEQWLNEGNEKSGLTPEQNDANRKLRMQRYGIFIDLVTIACLIWGLFTVFPLREVEATCPQFLEDFRAYSVSHRASLVTPLVLTLASLFIKSPYFETFMTYMGLYEAVVVFKILEEA